MRCCRTCCAIYRNGFDRCPIDGSELSPFDSDPVVGTTINGLYEVEACVGEGAMGRVYRAHHLRLRQRQVALKILLGDLAASVTMRLRFTQEAQAASVLSHANVVPVLDFGKTPLGLLYLAMEFVEGRSLARVIAQEGPLAPERVIRLVRQLCLGLAHAHSHGLVHRDFKPDNVIVVNDSDGEIPRIADFGLAIFADPDEEAARLTSAGTVVGTPLYTAPEQAMDRDIDLRTDLFALGVSMFEMLAGRPPFADSSPVEVLHHNMASQRPRIGQRSPGVFVPPALEQIVHRLMNADRDQRYASAHAVVEALDALGWRAIGSGDSPVQLATGSMSSAPAAEPPRPVRRRLGTAAIAGGLALALVALLGPPADERAADGRRGAVAASGEGARIPSAAMSEPEPAGRGSDRSGNEQGANEPGSGQRAGDPRGTEPGTAQPGSDLGASEPGSVQPGGDSRGRGGGQPGGDPRASDLRPSDPRAGERGGQQPGSDPRASDLRAGGRGGQQPGGDPRASDLRAGGRGGQQPGSNPPLSPSGAETERAAVAGSTAKPVEVARGNRPPGATAAVAPVPDGPRGESIESADLVAAEGAASTRPPMKSPPARPSGRGANTARGAAAARAGAAIAQPGGQERAPARPAARALALPRRSIETRGLRPVIGALSVDGSLSDAEVRRAVDRVATRLDACARAAPLATVVRADFLIDENGRAAAVRATGAGSLARCVASALGAVRTRVAPDVGDVRVSLRVHFSASPTR